MTLRLRPAARVVVLDPEERFLLFHFVKPALDLAYWSFPGGAVEEGESWSLAAKRELWEETGLAVDSPGKEIGSASYPLLLSSGERVTSDERLFLLRFPERPVLSQAGFTPNERQVIDSCRWWSLPELEESQEIIYPPGIASLIRKSLYGEAGE